MTVYKHTFAWVYHNLLSGDGRPDLDDPFTRDIRAPLITQAQGDVLEIGAGDGGNLSLYPPGVHLTLLEPNPYLLKYAQETAARLGLAGCRTVGAFAEDMPFPDDHFDTVVATHVLCSVRDQAQALAEIRRVLRPGGRFLFLEHVSASPRSMTYRLQRLINPAWQALSAGCHLTRDTGETIREAGFGLVEIKSFEAGFFSLVSPHVLGSAQA